MLDLIWGLKTQAMFDVWSIEHVLSGISAGSIIKDENKRHLKKYYPTFKFKNRTIIRFDLIFILLLAYIWETFEHYLEEGILGNAVEYWFQGVEFWANRFVFDPLLVVLGYYIATKFPKFILPARILSIFWLLIHIFVFPHSMYLHEFF